MTGTDNDDICPKCKSSKAAKYDEDDWSYVCMNCNVRWLPLDDVTIVREHGMEDSIIHTTRGK